VARDRSSLTPREDPMDLIAIAVALAFFAAMLAAIEFLERV
jgi:hypothetical protein